MTYNLTVTDMGERDPEGASVQRVETAGGEYLGVVIEIPGGWGWSPRIGTDDMPELRTTAMDSAQDLAQWFADHHPDLVTLTGVEA
jgi:hypothetical protein